MDPLCALLAWLEQDGYRFITPTPATHARVLAREPGKLARNLRDVFGWSLAFERELLPSELFDILKSGDLIEACGNGRLKSRLRVSSIGERLFLHSAYPTEAEDAVFFGPDTYRYVDFVRSELHGRGPVKRLVDVGAGTGAGAVMAAALVPHARLTLLDVNAAALRLAEANVRNAGLEAERIEGGSLDDVPGPIDLVIANPPYIMDESGRDYRDGGDMHGARVSLDWTLAAARRLERDGRMLLYTGVAIVEGRDELREALERRLPALGCTLSYRELDPDVFGEELEKRPYRDVERIAAVGAVVEAAR